MRFRPIKCQAAVEYLLLLAVLLLVLIVSLTTQGKGLRGGIETYTDGLGTSIANIIEDEG